MNMLNLNKKFVHGHFINHKGTNGHANANMMHEPRKSTKANLAKFDVCLIVQSFSNSVSMEGF